MTPNASVSTAVSAPPAVPPTICRRTTVSAAPAKETLQSAAIAPRRVFGDMSRSCSVASSALESVGSAGCCCKQTLININYHEDACLHTWRLVTRAKTEASVPFGTIWPI